MSPRRLTPRRRAQRPSERPATDITADKESFGLISAVGSVFSVMNKVANSVPGIITHPVRKLKDSLLSSNHGEEETAHSEDGAEPMTLEGFCITKRADVVVDRLNGRNDLFAWIWLTVEVSQYIEQKMRVQKRCFSKCTRRSR
jgi:hypothetical protein